MKKILSRFFLFLQYKRRFLNNSPFKILNFLLESQYWDKIKLQEYQALKMNDLIEIAKLNTDYYKNRFLRITLPLQNLELQVNQFPRLTKEDIKSKSEMMLNNKFFPVFEHRTSGSTGKPLSIYVSRASSADRLARLFRFLNWWGVKIYDRNILLWGVKSSENRTLSNFKNWIRNRKTFDPLMLNDDSVKSMYFKILDFNPVYIRGYTSSIMQFAKLLDKNQLIFKSNKLKVIIVTAEMLFEDDRKYIEKIFNCKVANEYGAAELGIIANECPDGSMHINEESVYLTTDALNNLIVTDLSNLAMPIISYENEDRISLSDKLCKCGRTSRIIKSIEGRYSDMINCPDGTQKGQVLFYYLMNELDSNGFDNCIKQYKFYQKKMNFILEIVIDDDFNPSVYQYIKSRMGELIGPEITLEIKIVTKIKREKSGKLRFFVNFDSENHNMKNITSF